VAWVVLQATLTLMSLLREEGAVCMKAWISEIKVLVGGTEEEETIVAHDSVVESDGFSNIYKYSIHEL
jgi:hypothetical protein